MKTGMMKDTKCFYGSYHVCKSLLEHCITFLGFELWLRNWPNNCNLLRNTNDGISN